MKDKAKSSVLQLSQKAILASLSLSLYWGCALLAAGADAASIGHNDVWQPFAGFLGVLFALITFGALPRLVASKTGGRAVRVVILIGPLLGILEFILGWMGLQLFFLVPLLSRGLLGVSMGFVLAHLGSFMAHQEKKEATLLCIIAFLVGALLYVLCSGFILTYGNLTITCLSLVSAIAFLLARFDERGYVHSPADSASPVTEKGALCLPEGFWPLFAGLFFYSIVYGITIPLTLDVGEGSAHSTPIELVLLVPGFISLFIALRFQDSFDFRRFQWFLFAPGILALIVLPFGERDASLACCAVLIMVFSFFDLASFILLVDLARNRSAALTMRVFAWGRLANIAGMVAGWGVASIFLGSALDRTGGEMAVPAFIGVTILVVLMTFSGNASIAPVGKRSTESESSDNPGGKTFDIDARCHKLAETNKLSVRESELFRMLARGRSTSYIADSLCLAPSTVKTHTNRIYRKLGVHTRQELIDLVEGNDRNRKDEK